MFISTRLSLLPRRLHVFLCAVLIYIRIKLTQVILRLLGASEERRARAWSRTHARCGARLARLARRRGALWLKFAQYAASRADVLPPEYPAALDACLDDAPPLPPRVALAAVEAELASAGGVDSVLRGFDPAKPIASASIAQVHRATLASDGRLVVIKVQRPGVRAVLLQDLEDLTTILDIVAGAEPDFDFRPMLEAWMDMVPRETDFIEEMRNSDRVSGVLTAARGTRWESRAFVPDVVPEYTTERVLCVEFVDGCSIRDIDALKKANVNCDHLITEITKAFALQLLVLGRFTGDPHPGNCLVKLEPPKNGQPASATPALIDFGITVELSKAQRLGFCRTIVAAVENDTFSLLQSFADMDIKLNRVDPQASMETIRHLFRSTASREENVRQSNEFFERQKDRQAQNLDSGIAVDVRDTGAPASAEGNADSSRRSPSRVFRFSKRKEGSSGKKRKQSDSPRRSPVDAYPGFLVFMFRTLGLLRGLSTRLGVEHAYLPIMYDYAKQSLRDSVPDNERITSVVYPQEKGTGSVEGLAQSLQSRKAKRARRIVSKVLEELEKRGHLIGCQVAAFIDGKVVLDVAAGQMGKHNPRPVTPSSLFCTFSVTKGVMAILFAELCDEFNIEYDDLVGKHWPDFACKGKETTTIGDLLAHRAGLAEAAPDDMRMLRLRDDWRGIVKWLAQEASPAHKPGEKAIYHYLNFGWLLTGIIEKVSGASLQARLEAFVRKLSIENECFIGLPSELCPDVATSRIAVLKSEIFTDIERLLKLRRKDASNGQSIEDESSAQAANMDKLYSEESEYGGAEGMKYLYQQILGNTSSNEQTAQDGAASSTASVEAKGTEERISSLFAKTPYLLEPQFFSHPVMRAAVIPSANGHFSARALARMYGMLANDGSIDDSQVLKRGRVRQMMEVRPWSASAAQKRASMRNGESSSSRPESPMELIGAGLRVYDCVDVRGTKVKSKAIGHGGVGGSMAFCIPDKKFSFAFCCNQLNAFSAAEAVLVSAVCAAFGMPIPSAYGELMRKARQANFEEPGGLMEVFEEELDRQLNAYNVLQAMTG